MHEILEILKWSHSLIGDVSLVVWAISGIGAIAVRYTRWPDRWRFRLQGIVLTSGLLAMLSAGQFLYQRWSIDSREIPADQLVAFKEALSPFASDEVISVVCFQQDHSSCRIAGQYRDLLSDTWSLADRVTDSQMPLVCQESDPNVAGLKGRIWVVTTSEHDRPKGARALHDELFQFRMHPGYRNCPAFGPTEFALIVGVSANGYSN
jgi:hypothetical protein